MAQRTLLVSIPALGEAHRARVADAAAAHGFEARFIDDLAPALDAARDAEIIFAQPPEFAQRATRLRWLCTPSAGVDQFAVPGLFASPEAVLTNSTGAYGVTIAEHIVMSALALMRRLPEYAAFAARREWQRDLPVQSLFGCRATLLGTGDIGRETALRLRAFAPASVVGVNRSGISPGAMFDFVVPQAKLDARLPETDLLVAALPGTPETEGMLDARRLALLPDGATVINVGRGSLIDEAALARELRAGRLRAALDVFAREPLAPDDPLWDCPNLLISTHVAGNMALPHTVDRVVELFLEDFERYCAGEPLARRVDLGRGY